MVHTWFTRVFVDDSERRASYRDTGTERACQPADELGLARTEIASQYDNVTGCEYAGEPISDCSGIRGRGAARRYQKSRPLESSVLMCERNSRINGMTG